MSKPRKSKGDKRALIPRTFPLTAEMVQRMEAAREEHGVVWTHVVRRAIEEKLDELYGPEPDDDQSKNSL